MTQPLDLAGRTFGRLTVKSRAKNSKGGRTRFTCVCRCGEACVVLGGTLTRGATVSCGCFRREAASTAFSTHGLSKTAEYRTWTHMKTRCYNPKCPHYNRYGGRGIGVCSAWRDSFETFYADMGPRPTRRHSIDRINNDAGYSPENCRWATPIEQSGNRTTVRRVEHGGVVDSMAGWSRRTGVGYTKLRRRITAGWTIAQILAESSPAAAR